MTDKLREAAQMALDALENSSPKTVLIEKAIAQGGDSVEIIRSILKRHTDITEAIRAALAQPETPYLTGARLFREGKGISFIQTAVRTDADIGEALQGWEDAKTSEEIAQPEQEPIKHWSDCAVHNAPAYPAGKCDCGGFPVAWFDPKGIHLEFDIEDCFSFKEKEGWKPVYTAPPQREWQGLTENEIKHLWYEACQTNLELTSQLIVHLARNIEAKLKEKNGAI